MSSEIEINPDLFVREAIESLLHRVFKRAPVENLVDDIAYLQDDLERMDIDECHWGELSEAEQNRITMFVEAQIRRSAERTH